MIFSHQRNWIDRRLHIHIRVFKKHCCDCSATFHAWHHPIHIFTTITGRRNVSIFASQHPDLHWNNFPEWRTWAFHMDGNKINSIHFSPYPRPGRGIFMFRGRGLSGIGVGFLRRIFPGGDQVVGVLHQLLLAFIVQLGDRFRQGLKNGGGGGNGRNGARRNNIP